VEVTVQTDTYQITVEDGITIAAPRKPAATSNGTKPPTTVNRPGPPDRHQNPGSRPV